MQYQEYIQRVQQASHLVEEARYKDAVDALYQLVLSDISDVDKADICAKLAYAYDRLGDTTDALDWFEKGIAYERNICRYEVAEKKAQYLSQLGHSEQAVPIYEALMKESFVSESEKERIRKTIQSFLGKAMRDWR